MPNLDEKQINLAVPLKEFHRVFNRKRCAQQSCDREGAVFANNPPIQNSINPKIRPSTNPYLAFVAPTAFTFTHGTDLELSPHSALMGGQFPTKKDFGAFKSPYFMRVIFPEFREKTNCPFRWSQKRVFTPFFSGDCGNVAACSAL